MTEGNRVEHDLIVLCLYFWHGKLEKTSFYCLES